jgi:hypothetical protein
MSEAPDGSEYDREEFLDRVCREILSESRYEGVPVERLVKHVLADLSVARVSQSVRNRAARKAEFNEWVAKPKPPKPVKVSAKDRLVAQALEAQKEAGII